jgi:coenzyme F420-0:L-glutamate ligase/coenzyme F420-1:gamma-L-glutamate ligase
MIPTLQVLPLRDFPLVVPGDDLAKLLRDALQRNQLSLEPGDVLVLAQKIVSKAEGRYAALASVTPGEEALALAQQVDKDPRLVELILRESAEVVRARPGVVIVEHRHGYVHANAGIDRSNLPGGADGDEVLLLPEDPDASAAALLVALGGAQDDSGVAVIINDSAGRAWRNGTVGMAIGCAGIEVLRNQVGEPDLFGRTLEVTEVAVADEIAAAASLVMGQADEACPVVLVRGANWRPSAQGSTGLIRDRALDMFR